MAFPTVTTPSPANARPASIVAIFAADASTNKWQTLGSISGGILQTPDYTELDSVGRNKSHGTFEFIAKCNMKQCSLTELELIDSICDGTNAFLFKLADAAAIPTGGATATTGWMKVTAAQVSPKFRIVAGGTPENNRIIELDFHGTALLTDKTAMYKASIDDDEFASSADSATAPYYAIGTYTATKNGGVPKEDNRKSSGVASITIADNAGGSAVTMSPIKNVNLIIEELPDTDKLLRHLPLALNIDISYEWTATDAADLLLLKDMSVLAVDVVITMLDGVVFTFTDQTGIETILDIDGDFEKSRVVRFVHKGKVLQSSLDGIVS